MKKILPNKEERLILLIGIPVIILMLALGLTKSIWSPEKDVEIKDVSNVSLLAKEIQVEAGDEISTDITNYLKGDESELKLWNVDLSKVENTKVGEYTAYVRKDKETKKFTVKIVDTKAPEITLSKSTINWLLDGTGTVDTIKAEIGAKAIDLVDGDISSKITGWPDSLPTGAGDITYTLVIKDAAGNESSVTFRVVYSVPSNTQSNTPNWNTNTGTNTNTNTDQNTGGNTETPVEPPVDQEPVEGQ